MKLRVNQVYFFYVFTYIQILKGRKKLNLLSVSKTVLNEKIVLEHQASSYFSVEIFQCWLWQDIIV